MKYEYILCCPSQQEMFGFLTILKLICLSSPILTQISNETRELNKKIILSVKYIKKADFRDLIIFTKKISDWFDFMFDFIKIIINREENKKIMVSLAC